MRVKKLIFALAEIVGKRIKMNDLLLILSLIFVGQTLGCLIGLIKEPKETVYMAP